MKPSETAKKPNETGVMLPSRYFYPGEVDDRQYADKQGKNGIYACKCRRFFETMKYLMKKEVCPV